MKKKLIVYLITILFLNTFFLSVDGDELNLLEKDKIYYKNDLLIPITVNKKLNQLPFESDYNKNREIFIPNIEPIYIDNNIVNLIEKLNEDLILQFLENLTSFGPRVTTTEACEKSGDYIYNEFVNMGLDTRYHYWENNGLYGKNIEATIYGYDNTADEIYIICAHYDSVEDSPGADDDGSGVAAVMAAAKLMSGYICKNTVKFIAFSGEEQGLVGSYYYVDEALNNNTNIAGVLNVDMIGYAETEEETNYIKLYQDTNNPFEWLTNYTVNVSEEYFDLLNLEVVPSGWSWGSDHYYFWKAGYNAIFYAEKNFNRYYHSIEDTIENMNISYIVKNSKLIIATLAELAEISDLQSPVKPIITKGEVNGKYGEQYNYSAFTTDPQNDEIYYFWDWGDNTNSDWIGPYESGIECEISNIWEKRGNYNIKVKSKDYYGHESEWSDPLSISMPKDKQIKTLLQKIVLILTKLEKENIIFSHIINKIGNY